jgi:hypothetical protein
VALGTLIPVSVSTLAVMYPAACRRVGLPLAYPFAHGIWPALWPALVMVVLLVLARPLLAHGLVPVALHLAVGGLVYTILFVSVAMDADERRLYWTRARRILARQRHTPATV